MQHFTQMWRCEATSEQISINIIMKRLSVIGRKKFVEPDGIPRKILKLGGEAMSPYLARLLVITMNNNAIPGDWKIAIMVLIYKGEDLSVVRNYRPVSLTLFASKWSTCYNKNYQQMLLFYYVFISFSSSFPYMFRAFMSPSSGVFQAVVFMLPFGSCSALLIVCVRQRTGLWWWFRCTRIEDARNEKPKVYTA